MSLRQAFLNAACKTKKVVEVPTPELEDCPSVYVRVLSGKEMDAYDSARFTYEESTQKYVPIESNATARFCAFAMCDQDGKRLFTAEEDDVNELGKLPARILNRIYTAAAKINLLHPAAEKDKGKDNGQGENPPPA
jgi:hypothetical protein